MKNHIINADCIQYMSNIKNNEIFTHTITDIPYGVVSRDSNGLRNFNKEHADIIEFDLRAFIQHITRLTKEKIMIFCSSEQVSELITLLNENDFKSTLAVWKKTNPSPVNGQYIWLSGVECCVVGSRESLTDDLKNVIWTTPSGRSKNHPTEKPLKLMDVIIKQHTKEKDSILDPCAGSGSTLEAAAINNREWTGIEKYVDYFNFIVRRMEKYG